MGVSEMLCIQKVLAILELGAIQHAYSYVHVQVTNATLVKMGFQLYPLEHFQQTLECGRGWDTVYGFSRRVRVFPGIQEISIVVFFK